MTRKRPFGTQLPAQLVDQLRTTVVHLQRTDPTMTISRFTEEALIKALADLPAIESNSAALRPRAGKRIQSDPS